MADPHLRGACKQITVYVDIFCVPLSLLCYRHSNTLGKWAVLT